MMTRTRFERFCLQRNIETRHLATFSDYTTHHINKVKRGVCSPTIEFVAAMVKAARQHTCDNSITANQMFELDDDDAKV